jgi:hypothetical protein
MLLVIYPPARCPVLRCQEIHIEHIFEVRFDQPLQGLFRLGLNRVKQSQAAVLFLEQWYLFLQDYSEKAVIAT